MKKGSKRKRILSISSLVTLIGVLGLLGWISFLTPFLKPHFEEGWRFIRRGSRGIIGWNRDNISSEERRIREEVILKKMREADLNKDWRSYAPEYPTPPKIEASTDEERIKILKKLQAFKEIEKELKNYLREKEDQFNQETPAIPPIREGIEFHFDKDRAADKVIEGLLTKKEIASSEKPLEENILLGIKGPLVARKIVERPNAPHVRVKTEAEIELTFWVLPNGVVDRVIPKVKGDAELEKIAIQYLKKWRFAPLSTYQPQVEQWGTIQIKFKIQ